MDWNFVLGATADGQVAGALSEDLHPTAPEQFEAKSFAQIIMEPGQVVLHPFPGVEPADLLSVITGSLAALLLGRGGHLVLHGTTLRFGSRLVIVCGQAGAGKSTLSAYLALHDRPFHADDVAPVAWQEDTPVMFPGYSGARLFPETLELLSLDPARYPTVHRFTRKRLVTLGSPRTAPEPALPIAGVVFLEEAPEFDLQILTEREAVVSLLNLQHPTAAHAADVSGATRSQVFRDCAGLARQARIIRIRRAKTFANLTKCASELNKLFCPN